MSRIATHTVLPLIIAAALVAAAGTASADDSTLTKCTMQFELKSWSFIFKSGTGHGTITCANGQSAKVKLQSTGGGLTAGRSKVPDGTGRFTEVGDISELFGSYAVAGAHAGAGQSADASVVTKGEISLTLVATGTGVELGIAAGKFTIEHDQSGDDKPASSAASED